MPNWAKVVVIVISYLVAIVLGSIGIAFAVSALGLPQGIRYAVDFALGMVLGAVCFGLATIWYDEWV